MSGKEYAYKVGETVNESLEIVSQTRKKSKLKNGKFRTNKGYIVQSLVYPDAPSYEVSEVSLQGGVGCAYKAGKRLLEENSLYAIKTVHKYLMLSDDEMKQIHKGAHKTIEVKCTCGKRRDIRVEHLVSNGIACNNCSKGTSYPELFFIAYNESMQLGFNTEVSNLFDGHRFDFVNYEHKVIVETHGMQHFKDMGFMNYDRTVKSDEKKREWCKENGWILIELDCRISSFEYIKDSINGHSVLPSINENKVGEILKIIENNKAYDSKTIIKMYEAGQTVNEVAEVLKMSTDQVSRVLKKNNVKMRGNGGKRRVTCITTGDVYNTIAEAERKTGITRTLISRCCRGKARYAGESPSGNKLIWEYID